MSHEWPSSRIFNQTGQHEARVTWQVVKAGKDDPGYSRWGYVARLRTNCTNRIFPRSGRMANVMTERYANDCVSILLLVGERSTCLSCPNVSVEPCAVDCRGYT